MIDFAEEYYIPLSSDEDDMAIARKKAFSYVLPIIMEKELTPRQNACFKYKYIDNKTQGEIADLMKLSQSTVSRHISTAKDIINTNLKYCYLALVKGMNEYERLSLLC